MFSWELDDLIKRNNYILSKHDYCSISFNTCPQISRIKYDPFENKFEIWTLDGYYWKIEIKPD